MEKVCLPTQSRKFAPFAAQHTRPTLNEDALCTAAFTLCELKIYSGILCTARYYIAISGPIQPYTYIQKYRSRLN